MERITELARLVGLVSNYKNGLVRADHAFEVDAINIGAKKF